MLPVIGSFYTQANTITLTAVLASLPIGLYTMVVLYFHHFLHWRADKTAGKITPVVALGEHGARVVGALLLLLIAIILLVDVFLGVLPWYSIVAALTIIPIQFALRNATGDLKQYLKLMATNFNGDMQASLLILIALLVRGFVHV
jgi:1,4-dihydroxy-2-naphthoate octaprenyltransferase